MRIFSAICLAKEMYAETPKAGLNSPLKLKQEDAPMSALRTTVSFLLSELAVKSFYHPGGSVESNHPRRLASVKTQVGGIV